MTLMEEPGTDSSNLLPSCLFSPRPDADQALEDGRVDSSPASVPRSDGGGALVKMLPLTRGRGRMSLSACDDKDDDLKGPLERGARVREALQDQKEAVKEW